MWEVTLRPLAELMDTVTVIWEHASNRHCFQPAYPAHGNEVSHTGEEEDVPDALSLGKELHVVILLCIYSLVDSFIDSFIPLTKMRVTSTSYMVC